MSNFDLLRQLIIERLKTWRPNRTQVVRFAISLALAMLLWGWVTQREDPFETEVYSDLPIEESLDSSLIIVNQPGDAEVSVRAPRSVLEDTGREDVTVTLDTEDINDPGTYTVEIRASVPGVSNVKVTPEEVLVTVEQQQSVVFPLTQEINQGSDQDRAIDSISPEVSQVTVTGPQSAVERVDKVVLEVTLNPQQTSDFQVVLIPVAQDINGYPISEVQISPGTVTTRVDVVTRGKRVSITANVVGSPAEGYTVTQRRVLPDSILVDGPDDVLANLLFVNTEPVNIDGMSQNYNETVGLEDLPPGVEIVDENGGRVEVRVQISRNDESTQTITSVPVQVIGLSEGLSAELNTTTVSLQVSASAEILQAMDAADVKVSVDLTGLGPGTYAPRPQVALPQGVTWVGNDPATISVTITEVSDEGTPNAPQSSPASTPEASLPTRRS